jgi:hypothetical protein
MKKKSANLSGRWAILLWHLAWGQDHVSVVDAPASRRTSASPRPFNSSPDHQTLGAWRSKRCLTATRHDAAHAKTSPPRRHP